MNRYPFSEIFQEKEDGSLETKRTININGVTVHPNVSFLPGTFFGGVDFHKYKGWSIDAEEEDNVLFIKAFFKE